MLGTVAATATTLVTSSTDQALSSSRTKSTALFTTLAFAGWACFGAHVVKLAMSITTTRVAFDCALLLLSLLLWLVGVDKLAIAAKTFALYVWLYLVAT